MKKIFFLLMSVVLFFSAEAQAPNNDPTKYVWYKYIYGNKTPRMWADSILDVPHDTTRSKTGWSKTAGNLPYWGNDTTWFAPLRSITSDLQEGDAVQYHSDGSIYNFHGVPGSETSFSGTPTVIDLGNLNYFVNTNGPYKINGTAYPSASGLVTLPVGTAGVDSGRVDLIVATPSGVGSVQGTNSDDPQEPVADITTTLKITSVLILEDDTTPATPSLDVQVYDENTGFPGEFVFSTSGTITANANNATNLLKGAKDIAITAMNTTGHGIWTYGGTDTLTKTNYTYLIIPIRVDATINAATNYTIQIGLGTTFSNAVPVTTWAIPTFKTASTSYKYVAIPMTEFTGNPKFKIIRINRTGTGGTVNLKLDDIKLQKVGFTSDDGTSLIGGFVRNDTLYGIRKNGANVFMGVVNGATNLNINDFFAKPSHIVTNKHTAWGQAGILNGVIVIPLAEGNGHLLEPGTIPVSYSSTNQGRSYTRVALPLTGITGAASDDIRNVAAGNVLGQFWAVFSAYRNANDVNGTRLLLYKTSNGSTWTNPTLVTTLDTNTYKGATSYGSIRQFGSRIGFSAYAQRSGGVSVELFIYTDDSGTTWNHVEVGTGNTSNNYLTEGDWMPTSATAGFMVVRRELQDPVVFKTSDAGSTWALDGTLTIATSKGFSDKWHAPSLYQEGSEFFCLFSDRAKGNVVQISTTNPTSAAGWNSSNVRIVANSIMQTGFGSYDFGYCSTIGSGENRQLVYYDISPTTIDPGDLSNINTDVIIKAIPLTARPMFGGRISNTGFTGGGNTNENENGFVFDRSGTIIDNRQMLGLDSQTITIPESGIYEFSAELSTSSIGFASLAQVDVRIYNQHEDTSDLAHSYVLGAIPGQGIPRVTLYGKYPLFKGQIVKISVNIDADETLVSPPIPYFWIMREPDNGMMNGGNGTTINQTVYDTTAADQLIRDTLGAHNLRLSDLENAGSGGSGGPDGMNGTATVPVTVNMAAQKLLIANTAYPDGNIEYSNTGKVSLGDVDGSGVRLEIDPANNIMRARLGASGVFRTNSLADTSNYVPESYTTMAWVTDHILNAGGGGGSGLTVGTSTITSGTNTRILYNNSGTLGEYTVTGTGTTAVLSTSPTFTTGLTTPLAIGGTGTTSTLTLKTTTGVGTTAADIIGLGGNNGGTELFRARNDGKFTINGATANAKLNTASFHSSGNIDIGTYFGDATVGVSVAYGSSGQYSASFYNSGAARTLMRIAADGYIGFGNFNPGTANSFEFRAVASNKLGLVLKGASGQTASLVSFQDNSANELSSFDANGSFSNRLAYVAKSGSYTATISDAVIEVTATGQTITLPTSVGKDGKVYTIKLTASGSSTVATTSSQTIDGSTTYSLASQYKYVTVQSNGANWIVIANN